MLVARPLGRDAHLGLSLDLHMDTLLQPVQVLSPVVRRRLDYEESAYPEDQDKDQANGLRSLLKLPSHIPPPKW